MSGRKADNVGLKLGVLSSLLILKMFNGLVVMSHGSSDPWTKTRYFSDQYRTRIIDNTGVRLVSISSGEFCYPVVVFLQKSHLVHNGSGWYLQTLDCALSDKTLPNTSGLMQPQFQ